MCGLGYVLRELMECPRMGFGVPIDEWLREPLRDWAKELLAEKRQREESFLIQYQYVKCGRSM